MRFLPNLIVLLLAAGCYNPPPEGLRATDGGRTKREPLVPTIGSPIWLAGTRYLAFPFAVRLNDEGRSKVGLGPSSFGSNLAFYGQTYDENPGVHGQSAAGWVGSDRIYWNNVLLLDQESRATRMLFDRKVVITAAYFPGEGNKTGAMLVAAVDADTNADKYINDDDAVVLYFAVPDGKTLVPLTPMAGSQFRGLTYGEDGRVLYVRTRRDADGDGAFTAADETVLLRVDLSLRPVPNPGTPMLPADLVRRAFELVAPAK